MYPPAIYPPVRRRRGVDPIADFLEDNPPEPIVEQPPAPLTPDETATYKGLGVDAGLMEKIAAAPRGASTDLSGTRFVDPVRDYLLSENKPLPANVQRFDTAVDTVFGPIESLTRMADNFADRITQPKAPDQSLAGQRVPFKEGFRTTDQSDVLRDAHTRGFIGGSAQGAAQQATPFNIATTLASPLTKGLGTVGQLARLAEGAGGGFEVGMSMPELTDAIGEGDWNRAALAGGMTAFGALGAGLSLRQPTGPTPPPYDAIPRVKDRGNVGHIPTVDGSQPAAPGVVDGTILRDPLSVQQPSFGPSTQRLLERGQYNMPPEPTRPPGPMDLDLPKLRQQFMDAVVSGDMDTANGLASELTRRGFPMQRLLPESTDGPIITPPPPPGPPPPPTIPEASRWQQPPAPQNPASPSAGPATVAGQPASSQAPAAVAPSAPPPAAGFSPAEIANLRRMGYSDALIAKMAQQGTIGAAPDPLAAIIQPDRALIDSLPPLAERMAARRSAGPPTTDPIAQSDPGNIGRSGEEGQRPRLQEVGSLPEGFDELNRIINEPDIVGPLETPPTRQVQPDLDDVDRLEAEMQGNLQRVQPKPDPNAEDPLARLLGTIESGKMKDPATSLERMKSDADIDPLTKLVNRGGFDNRRQGEQGRLIGRLDVDNFKAVNDALGHAEGDRALQIVADTLRQFTRRRGDLAARLGGDEFGLDLGAPTHPEGATQLRDTIENAIATALADAGFGEVAGRKIAASLGFGADEAAADAAALARKAERGVSQPRGPAPIDGGIPAGVDSGTPNPNAQASPAGSAPDDAGNLAPDETGADLPDGSRLSPPRTRNDAIAKRANERWPDTLADARQNGFTGTDDELRRLYDEAVESARTFLVDMDDIDAEDDIFAKIRELGGLDPSYFKNDDGSRSGEMTELRQLLDRAGMKGKNDIIRTGAGANAQANRVAQRSAREIAEARQKLDAGQITQAEHDQIVADARAAATAPVSSRAGMSLDDLATHFKENDTRFGVETDHELLEYIKQRLRDKIDGTGAKAYTFDDVLEGAVGVRKGQKWWEADDSFDVDSFDEGGAGRPIDRLEADPDNPDYVRVPLEHVDESEVGTPDYSKPQLETVKIGELIATQPTLTRSAVESKLGRTREPLDQLPVGVHGRAPYKPGLPIILRGEDGRLFIGDGTHDITAALLDGHEDIQVITYPTKGAKPKVDILDTGEGQPRLPGDVGTVRDNATPTPKFEAPFSLSRQNADAPAPKQDPLASLLNSDGAASDTPAPVAPKPDAPAPSTLPEPRHGVKDPAKVETLAESMRKNGWQGRPVLVVKDGDVSSAWTATHRLEAAKLAGLKPSDVPMMIVDGAKLRAAGYDLDDITAGGKKKRIEALRAAGLEDAAKLLEDERIGSDARQNPPAGAADVEPMPDGVREFLTRQLRIPPAEVDAMSPADAIALGNKVRMHPGGVEAGIKEYARPKPTYRAGDPGPNLGEGSMRVESDELAKILGIQERKTALQRTRVEPGEGAPAAPKLSAAAIQKAQSLDADYRNRDTTPAAKKSQSEIGAMKGAMVQDARARAKLLETPTPENLDEYVRLMGEASDRQLGRELKGGANADGSVKKPVAKHERTGEYLASGLGGLEKMYREHPALFWGTLRANGGALLGALLADEEDDKLGAALAGAAVGLAGPRIWKTLAAKAPGVAKAIRELKLPGGAPHGKVSPVRGARDLTKDISGLEQYFGQPHRTVPDVWREISPILDEMADAERDLPSSTPRMMDFTRRMYVKEALAEIQHALKQTKKQGLHRRAAYLEQMIDELKETPTGLERMVSDLTSGSVKPRDVQKALARGEKLLYTKLLGFALDTGIINRTQIGLAIPHIGVDGVLKGMKASRTDAGRAATKFLDIDEPGDAPRVPGGRVKPSLLSKVVKMALAPLRNSDIRNRKDVYLGAMYHARKQGLDSAAAHEWAMEITAQTQGTPGELGANPFHRHLGPLRMFTKYPSIWGQWFADIVSHPDPAVRRRGAAYMLGVPIAGAALGVNTMAFMVPRLGLALPAAAAALDLASHVPGLNSITGEADHDLQDDASITGVSRYAGKVVKETKDFARYGLGDHPEFDRTGSPRGEHSAWSGFLSLLGVETSSKASDTSERNEAFEFTEDATRRKSIESRRNRSALREAIEGGDMEEAAEIAGRLTPQQRRDFYNRNKKSPYQLMLERVPKEKRAEFEEKFKDRMSRLGG